MNKTKTKQVIVFGTDAQVRGIGSILKKNGVEVVEAPALKPTPFVPAQSMDEAAATMLDLAVTLETNAKLLREWAEEILASTKRRRGQVSQTESASASSLLTVGPE